MSIKKIISLCLAIVASLGAYAQHSDNPVIMHINGKPITRAEFEYSYNKNSDVEGAVEVKTVKEYADMFVNYKLKVAAAEAQHLDTLSSFIDEFRQYRDMQLTPHLIDQEFIDSVAHSVYDITKERLGGKQLLSCRHILIQVKQGADEATKALAAKHADSVYNLIVSGENFEVVAKKYSQDRGSASKGGALPWLGPGMTYKEFEEAAYALNVGETSRPFFSPAGYHIINMVARKDLEPFDELKEEIYKALKQQGIEEASSIAKIEKLMAERGWSREEVMDSVLKARIKEDPTLEYLVQEYYDGLLLYEVAKTQVWDVAAKDETGLAAQYEANKQKYAWTEPRYRGFVFHAKNKAVLKATKKFLKTASLENEDWRRELKKTINKDSVVVVVRGPYLVKKGENKAVDNLIFKTGEKVLLKEYPHNGTYGKVLKQPSSFKDVRALVQEDYQKRLEDAWVEKLRNQFSFSINQEILDTVNKH